MSRSTVEVIINTLDRTKNLTGANPGKPSISTQNMVLMGLWTLATTESFRQISDRFDVSISTCHDIFEDFCVGLMHYRKKFIAWPTIQEMSHIANQFEAKTGFPGAVGAIDGCHVPIKKPMNDSDSYYNRKKNFSINLMAVVDNKMLFRDIFVGWPGSVHDSRVHRNSPLCKYLEENSLPGHLHILGDTAFPLSNWLLVPYKDNGHLTARKKKFNKKLSSTRVIVENAFGLLKGKFRRIRTCLDVTETKRASHITVAACVVHNIYILEEDWKEEEIYISESDDGDDDVEMETSLDAKEKRKKLMSNLL